MLEGGSFVGNESASVLSWFYSRIERLCPGRVGRSSGSRGVMFSSARSVFGSASLFLTQNSRASVRRKSKCRELLQRFPTCLRRQASLSDTPLIATSHLSQARAAMPIETSHQEASLAVARAGSARVVLIGEASHAPTSSTGNAPASLSGSSRKGAFAALRQRPTGRTPGA